MRRPSLIALLTLAGTTALISPALPALLRYGTLPHKADRPLNVVVAGVDVDYDDRAPVWPYPAKPLDFKARTDTLMLAQIHPDGKINLLSIQRDTWVKIAGFSGNGNGGWGKINGANKHGAEQSPDNPEAGPTMLMNTVQDLTGLPVDGYVYLSLNAVRDLTNAAGGVVIDVPLRMKYDDNAGHLHIDLQPGRQKLNGDQMQGFLRFRKDGMADIGRIGRQQAFVAALVQRVKHPLNWWRLPAMVGAVNRNTKTNLSREQVGALLGAALSGPHLNEPLTVPGRFGQGGTWVADRAALNDLLRQHFRDPNDPRQLQITVLNVAAPDGSARRLKDKLASLGYTQVSIGNAPRAEWPITKVAGGAARRVLQDLGYGELSNDAVASGADVTVWLGSDTPVP